MIRKCQTDDTEQVYFVINEASQAYERVIPTDCYHQPYMSMDELEQEMKRLPFFGWEINGKLVGLTGLELIRDVTLIRHAYVLTQWQRKGIGTRLLNHLKALVTTPRLLVGTWAAAYWAINFYQKQGFSFLPNTDELLRTYWDIPQRQIETSIVLGISDLPLKKESCCNVNLEGYKSGTNIQKEPRT